MRQAAKGAGEIRPRLDAFVMDPQLWIAPGTFAAPSGGGRVPSAAKAAMSLRRVETACSYTRTSSAMIVSVFIIAGL